jgi:DtxR family Mn-dependent transcriptional regulator
MTQEKRDEILEALWTLKEERGLDKDGSFDLSDLLHCLSDYLSIGTKEEIEEIVEKMIADGLLRKRGTGAALTETGEALARDITRRHRLAEFLLSEVFGLPEESMESSACHFEHILTPEVTNSICAFLGHPPACPHGKPIPQGDCCRQFGEALRPLVVKLSDLRSGEKGKIVFMSSGNKKRLEKLAPYGIIPGGVITLHQRRPSFVVQVGQTEIALDSEIVSDIYVRRIPENGTAVESHRTHAGGWRRRHRRGQ